jgi:HD-GYP domain-containing protein (c-di-GMP phosphodiesterase class II)
MAKHSPPPSNGPQLSGILAALSLISDMSRSRPAEEAMHACLVAVMLARSMGLSERDAAAVYYTTLLRSVGCTATSHEYSALYGDDLAPRGRGDAIDVQKPREVFPFLWRMSAAQTNTSHLRAFATVVAKGRQAAKDGARADCEVGARMAGRFGLDSMVQQGILGVFERWDGRGGPNGLAGEQISQAARFAAVAYAFVMFAADLGTKAACGRIQRWAGASLDPAIAGALSGDPDSAASLLEVADTWQAVVDAEPGAPRRVTEPQLDEIALAFADGLDLKSPWLHGHSSGVADLAATAAAGLGRPADEIARIRLAGLFHDIGRAGISTQIWDKPGPLTTAQWEQVRLHPYHTDRILSRCPALAPLAGLASMHHERLDGSGYFRAAPAATQDLAARVLAAADVYHALTEDRPYRPAFRPDEAARRLEAMALDGEAVRAVIEAAGGKASRRSQARPAGISDRELDVLRLLVRGLSEKDIAERLFISAATVHSHIAHIYEKSAVSTRAGLAMFAMENDLIRPGETAPTSPRIN